MYGKYVEDENILTTGASQTKGSMENNVRYCGMLKTWKSLMLTKRLSQASLKKDHGRIRKGSTPHGRKGNKDTWLPGNDTALYRERWGANQDVGLRWENACRHTAEEMNGDCPTSAADHLFDVDGNQTKVDEKRAQFFHTYVAKALFLCKRARPDLQTAVAFQCTRVKSCDKDDYKKLIRMLGFLRFTKDDF